MLVADLPWVGRAGQIMLLVGAVAILVCLLAGAARALVTVRRIGPLRRSLARHRGELSSQIADLTALRGENGRLMRPFLRARRWTRHPLVGALRTSYRLRRRRARAERERAPNATRRP